MYGGDARLLLMTQSGGFVRLLLGVMVATKHVHCCFQIEYLKLSLILLSSYKILGVFCLHHGPGPPARQLCKVVMPAFY